MRYRHFAPLGRELSLLVLGTAYWELRPPEQVEEVLEKFLALGGNVFDSGRQYGESERILAERLGERRDAVVVLTKGAHHDEEYEGGPILRRRVTPVEISFDLGASLQALRTEAIDLYMLHRDDPDQDVRSIVEVLNEHRRAGRIGAFGGSNWTTVRLEEANAYATEHGLEPFTFSSPNLALATWNEPPWHEAVSAHDPDSLAWYGRTQLPLFSWSAQGGGYFAGVQAELTERVYDSEANRERRRRAEELGRERGFTASAVALAWVLAQPFPTYAIIGPQSAAEVEESVRALGLALTPDEVRWLDLEEDGWQN